MPLETAEKVITSDLPIRQLHIKPCVSWKIILEMHLRLPLLSNTVPLRLDFVLVGRRGVASWWQNRLRVAS